ncbi:hypothetical protein HPB47_015097 [Ixodes persulcatus]|uniref:Uncharacterized protein n=4 Tax=Ixodes persulcatus TaxID=34615 RepID=A0AC60QLX1_IXOPE|nr:hypothetical protein HPB47_017986 [Ixodes persulcatus]KAG0437611.1 hypothetical protein HPB47_017363 [Ixodes persulcatus]KAG0443282.1 hypothetical protein HPB47_015097 [Ixodes persulcatus]
MDGLKEPPPYNTRRALKDREKTAAVDAILLDSIASQALERDVAMAEASTQNHEESSTQRITLVEPPSIYPDLSGINNGGQTPPSLQDGEPVIGISPEPQEGEPATHPSPVSQSKPCGPQAKDDSPLSPDSQETTSSHSPSPTPRSENEEESDSPPPNHDNYESEEETDSVIHTLPVENSFALLSPSKDKAPSPQDKADHMPTSDVKETTHDKAGGQQSKASTTVNDSATEAEDGPGTVLFRPAGQASFTINNRLRIASYAQNIAPGKLKAVRFNLARNILAIDTDDAATRRTLLGTQKLGEMEVVAFSPPPITQERGTIYGLNPRDADAFLRRGLTSPTSPIVHLRRFDGGKGAEICFDGPLPRFVDLFNVRFFVRPLKVRPTQCTQCGRLGHVRSACTMPTACPTCPEKHAQGECPRAQYPKCPNCGYLHRATDKRCPAYQRAKLEETIVRGTGCTRPEARKHAVAFAVEQKRRPNPQRRREECGIINPPPPQAPRPLTCAAWMNPTLTTFLLTRQTSEESRRDFPRLEDSNPHAAPPAPFQRGPARAAAQGATPQPTGSAANTASDTSQQPTGTQPTASDRDQQPTWRPPRSAAPAAPHEPRRQPAGNEENNAASDMDQRDQRDRPTEQNKQTRPKERRDNQRKEQEGPKNPPPYKETFGPANLSKRQRKRQRQAERHQNNSAAAALTEREDQNKQRRGQSTSPPLEEQDTLRRAHPPLPTAGATSAAQLAHLHQRAQQPLPPPPQAAWNGPSLPHDSVWSGGGLLPPTNGAPPPPFPLPPAAAEVGDSPRRDGPRPPAHPLEQLLCVTLQQVDCLLRMLGHALRDYAHLQTGLPSDSPVLTLFRHHNFPPPDQNASTA